MRVALPSLLVCVLGFLLGGFSFAACALAREPLGGEASLLGGPLMVPDAEALVGGQLAAAEESRLANPEAVAEREASRTKYEGLDAEQAAKLAGEAFPHIVDDPAGGPPQLPEGQRIVAYPTLSTAQLELPDHKHAVLESLSPIAIGTSPTTRVPINLNLRDAGSAFEPATPLVDVQIPQRLSEGVQLPGIGVSLTPVDGQGLPPAGSEGIVDGAVALFANTQTDTDTVVKPVTLGFEADTLLRSVESPEQLSFRLGLPPGSSLAQTQSGSGAVQVLDEGTVLAVVPPPSAQDAAGTMSPSR
jgi:hypothetical protein